MSSEVIIVPSLFFLIGFLFWVVIDGWQRRQHSRLLADLNVRLLERLGSVQEFGEFLRTGAGAAMLRSMTLERDAANPAGRLLRATQAGIVLVALGIGLLFLGDRYPGDLSPDYEGFTVAGVLALSTGVGFLVSVGASYYLARTLGVLPVARPGPSADLLTP